MCWIVDRSDGAREHVLNLPAHRHGNHPTFAKTRTPGAVSLYKGCVMKFQCDPVSLPEVSDDVPEMLRGVGSRGEIVFARRHLEVQKP